MNWFRCEKCNKPLLKLTEKSVIVNEIYCRCCKTSFDVIIQNGKVIKNEEIIENIENIENKLGI